MTASAETRPLSQEPPSRLTDGAGPRPVTRASDTASVWGLVWTLVRTDFKARYHGTPIGFVWALLKPTAMFVVLVGVFSFIFRDEPNYKLNLIIGLFLWDFFAEATKTGMTLARGEGVSADEGALPALDPRRHVDRQCADHAAGLRGGRDGVSGRQSAAARAWQRSRSFALLRRVRWSRSRSASRSGSSVLFLRYRDLNQIWDMATQAGFFLAPIIYPLGVIPERFHFYLYLWPPTPVIEFSRAALVDGAVPTLDGARVSGC